MKELPVRPAVPVPSIHPAATSAIILVFITALGLVAMGQGWLHPDESYYIISAEQMRETGNYLIPETVTGEARLKKPPLTYHFVVAGTALVGDTLLGARLFFVLGAAAVLGLTYALAVAIGAVGFGPGVAVTALASNYIFFKSGYTAIPDMPLTLGLTVSLLGFAWMLGVATRPAWVPFLAYGGLAVAALAKGLIAAPLLLLALGLRIWSGRRGWGQGSGFDRNETIAILLALLGAGWWYVWILLKAPELFLAQFMGDQVTDKAELGLGVLAEGLAFNASSLAQGFFPFLLVALFGRWSMPRPSRPRLPVLFLILWGLLVVFLFAFSSFLTERYIVPAMPAVAALIGLLAGRVAPENLYRRLRRVVLALGLLALPVAALSVAILLSSGALLSGLSFALLAFGILTLIWRLRQVGVLLVALVAFQALFPLAIYPGYRVVAMPEVWQVANKEIEASSLQPSQIIVAGTGKDNDARRLLVQLGLQRGPIHEYGFANGPDPAELAEDIRNRSPQASMIVTLSRVLAAEFEQGGSVVDRHLGSLSKTSFSELMQAIRARDFDQLREQGGKPVFLIHPP